VKNGRRKGSKAELQVAKCTEFWWRQLPLAQQDTQDGKPAIFVRTPMSGGWGSQGARAHYRVAGDLSSTSESWPFTVEVKRREGWSLASFINGSHRRSQVWDWWAQCCKGASEEGGVPMMWFRSNGNPWLVLLPDALATPRLGAINADIYWPDPAAVRFSNTTGIHPVGYLADKLLASDPKLWLGLRAPMAQGDAPLIVG